MKGATRGRAEPALSSKTLDDLISECRSEVGDETIQVRRSWEEMFAYTLNYFPGSTPVEAFDPDSLRVYLISNGMTAAIADGYAKRWRKVLTNTDCRGA